MGSWCGPKDDASVWLVARPQASACDASSKKVFSDAESPPDTSEGLTLPLDATQLTTFPAVLSVMGRYCGSTPAVCSDVQVALNVESYTQGQGAKGTWSFTPPGQAELKGKLEASWCSWDDFLPAHPDGERLARDIKIREVVGVPGRQGADRRATWSRCQTATPTWCRTGRRMRARVRGAGRRLSESRAERAAHPARTAPKPPTRFEQSHHVQRRIHREGRHVDVQPGLPKDAFQEGTQYSVELRETSKCTPLMGTPTGARFPEAGLSPVGARSTGPVKVMLVPVRYDADGSGRLPDYVRQAADADDGAVVRDVPDLRGRAQHARAGRHDPHGHRRHARPDARAARHRRRRRATSRTTAWCARRRRSGDYCNGSCTTGIAGFGSQNGTATAGMGIGLHRRRRRHVRARARPHLPTPARAVRRRGGPGRRVSLPRRRARQLGLRHQDAKSCSIPAPTSTS